MLAGIGFDALRAARPGTGRGFEVFSKIFAVCAFISITASASIFAFQAKISRLAIVHFSHGNYG